MILVNIFFSYIKSSFFSSPQVDVLFGKNCGFPTLLVGTGCYQWPQVEKLIESNTTDHIPNYYADSLGDLYKVFE